VGVVCGGGDYFPYFGCISPIFLYAGIVEVKRGWDFEDRISRFPYFFHIAL
jgi:hypothetical protein